MEVGPVDVSEVASADLVDQFDVIIVEFPLLPDDRHLEHSPRPRGDRKSALELVDDQLLDCAKGRALEPVNTTSGCYHLTNSTFQRGRPGGALALQMLKNNNK